MADSISSTTPLLLACRYGHAEIARRLLEAAARVDETNDLGDTALHEAAQLGQVGLFNPNFAILTFLIPNLAKF